MKEKSKSYLIKFILIIFAVYITLFGINNYFKSKSLNRPLPEVKLKEKIEKEKTFAIMISEDGSNYQKYESNEWPNENYKFKEAKCIDNNGNLIDNAVSFESATKTVILETDKTVVCTIYFDKSTLGKLRENEKLLNKDNLSSDLQGGMYRYQGTDNVANWICFGTEDNCGTNDELVDKYMYRIIGITPNDELYLIKETFIKEDETNIFMWNNKDSVDPDSVNYCTNGICPEWPQSILYKRLNGTSNGTQTGNVQTLDKE